MEKENSRGSVPFQQQCSSVTMSCVPFHGVHFQCKKLFFKQLQGRYKNEIALPHENHNFYRLSNINMQAQNTNIWTNKQA
jgi:hypothetical protein